MFRKASNSGLTQSKFSVGSRISANNEIFVIVAEDSSSIRLLRLSNFLLERNSSIVSVIVEDINFISEDELRELIRQTTDYAFSDFDFDCAGLKDFTPG